MADAGVTVSDGGLRRPLDGLLGYQLRRASVAMLSDLAEALAPWSLTVGSMSVLLLVEANPGATQSEIGRTLAIKRANMAPLTASLLRRGLLARVAIDGRSHGLALTAQGAALARTAHVCVAAHERRFLDRVPQRQHAPLLAMLRALWAEGD